MVLTNTRRVVEKTSIAITIVDPNKTRPLSLFDSILLLEGAKFGVQGRELSMISRMRIISTFNVRDGLLSLNNG